MKDSLRFNFNGTHSKDLGVMQVHSSSGLFEEEIFLQTSLNNTSTQKNGRVISTNKVNEPIEFTLTLYYSDPYEDKGTVRRIISWLNQEAFKPMSFDLYPNFLVYAKLQEIVSIQHNGLNEGILTVRFLTNSSYIYSIPYLTEIYTVTNQQSLLLNFEGDEITYPKVWIEKIGTGKLTLLNKSSNKETIFEEINDKEKLFIDGEKRLIYSDGQELGVYRENSHNRVWLGLIENFYDGTNEIVITGSCKIQFEVQYKYYTLL